MLCFCQQTGWCGTSLGCRFHLGISLARISRKNTAAQIPTMNTILIVTISTVIWRPREHRPPLGSRCGPPTPLIMVKCVELAIDTESGSLVAFVSPAVVRPKVIGSCCWDCESDVISSIEMMAAPELVPAGCSGLVADLRTMLVLYLLPTASRMAAVGTTPTVEDRYSSMARLVP
uniref:(northern house mosquito) hypothetical protein n=2 Tax=Culex pipiens TaxID=7175 RepID=A0A8D8HFM5_CULPI